MGSRPSRQWQPGAERHSVAKAAGTVGNRDAHPDVGIALEELGTLAGVPAQLLEDRSRSADQIRFSIGGELGEQGARHPGAGFVAIQQAVELEGGCDPMSGCLGEPGPLDQIGERGRTESRLTQKEDGFVQDADTASVSHKAILASHIVRWNRHKRAEGWVDMAGTLAEKVWESHVVRRADNEPDLLFIDLHLVHEVTSPQAFDGLRTAGRRVRRPDLTLATEDHNVPTLDIDKPIADLVSRTQIDTLRRNCAEFGIRLHAMGDAEQGIVHVIGPQLGLTQPGMTIVCGDSHTSTHGAFGALAFGIGTSEVEHVLATQTLPAARPRTMAVNVDGRLPIGVSAKDLILALITQIGTGGGQGYVIEYRGPAIEALSMEGRMTVCNMSIEAGARAGLIAPDETTFEFLAGRSSAPTGVRWDEAVAYWRTLRSDGDASFDAEVHLDASRLSPFVTWGTNPGQGAPLSARVPNPEDFTDPGDRVSAEKALAYMDLEPGTPLREVSVDTVFVGSCTNGRIEDLRIAADLLRGRKVAASVRMLVVPGSMRVKVAAEAEGLDQIFLDAGAQWRSAGCSMCLGMNPDQLAPGERSASTSNRNFEGRQGKGGRTHLVSPGVAAATAVTGHLTSPAELEARS